MALAITATKLVIQIADTTPIPAMSGSPLRRPEHSEASIVSVVKYGVAVFVVIRRSSHVKCRGGAFDFVLRDVSVLPDC